MNLIPLSPYNYEFKANNSLNKISYFYLEGAEGISHNSYEIIEKLIEQKLENVKNYNSFSIYVYKKQIVSI